MKRRGARLAGEFGLLPVLVALALAPFDVTLH